MTERRSYRSSQSAPVPPTPPVREETPTPPPPQREEQQGGSKYRNITGLFLSKSGKAHTVFLSAQIIEKLQQLQEGDTLGVSANPTNGRLGLWYVPNDAE